MSGSCKDELRREKLNKLVNIAPARLELAEVRQKLAAAKGKHYWRSLEELAETREFHEMLHREFPRQASEWTDEVSRRNFLKLMGASLAFAGLTACTRQPVENIVPYVRQPEDLVPGKPLLFASAMPRGANATPVLVKSDMGRPIKVEGNPEHPAGNLGTDVFAQASLLEMYDPDRSQSVTQLGDVSTWGKFLEALQGALAAQRGPLRGAGLRFLTERSTSPTLASQMRAVLLAFPEARWHQYEPVNSDNSRAGAQMAFGQNVVPHYRLENADVIVSLDADFLSSVENPQFLRHAAAFGRRRKAELKEKINRLYVVESTPTITGAKADHRLPLRASEIEQFARALMAQISGGGAGDARYGKFLGALAKDLAAHRGSSVVMAGETQPAAVHALAHVMNDALGNVGNTVLYAEPVEVTPEGFRGCVQSLKDLTNDVNAGKVDLLMILGGNPVYDAPTDFNFNESNQQLMKVPLRVHVGLYHNETSSICHWHINQAHYLESWGDVRTFDGTPTIVQPLIDPLYSGRTVHEVLTAFTNQPGLTSYEILRAYWHGQHPGADFENFWRKSLHDGFVPGMAFEPRQVTIRSRDFPASQARSAGADIEVVFRPDENIYDGRFANNGWLQELPRPLTLITWDNAVVMSLNTAEQLRVVSEDLVEVELRGRKLKLPVWIEAGVPDKSVTLHLGYGRTHGGRVAEGAVGANTYLLRQSDAMQFASGVKLAKVDGHYQLAATHHHHNMHGRGIVRTATVKEFEEHPDFAHEGVEEPPRSETLYPNYDYSHGYQWGMAIDLGSCIGCNTCVIACQAENNIPVVGKLEVTRGREMHWLRVDRYYTGSYENPKTHFQPVPCMQCENAPCEVVCPVVATVHSTEGLNDMVYNRCVGTRYCSNNCPYKVRRFNFFLYSDYETPVKKLLNNPDVTVRSRGVMEKCTYCVQRINRGRIEAEKAYREIEDGQVKTACQQACPADAIIFGNINDRNSRVAKLKAQPYNYPLLPELNTRPRTTYLAEIMNSNPELAERNENEEAENKSVMQQKEA
jgi:MoCo/4Fe-4S cofactor protein with predicted Tat translocation signal